VVLDQIKPILQSFKLPEKLLEMVLSYIRTSHEAEKEHHVARIKELQAESNTLTIRINRLMDLMLDGHIDEPAFKLKKKEMAFRQAELNCILSDNHNADDNFKDALCDILGLVSKSYQLFESSKVDYKRRLLGFVFSNLQLERPTLRYTLRKPFDLFAQLPHNPEWRPLRPSNRCFAVCRDTGLTHNYPYITGIFC
jgi:hypothetical protein